MSIVGVSMVEYTIPKLVEVTNDLRGFYLVGVLFCYNVNVQQMAGLTAPDGWQWVDLPYETLEPESLLLSKALCELRLLVRKAFARFTYRYLKNGICAVRIYLLPSDSREIGIVKWFRHKYLRYKRPVGAIDRQCLKIIRKLYTIMDFSPAASTMDATKFMDYIRHNEIVLVNFDKSMVVHDEEIPCDLNDNSLMKFHLNRLITNQAFRLYRSEGDESKERQTLQNRVLNIYTNFKSPVVDKSKLNEYQLELYNNIMSDEIPGFKSELYMYQRRSVAKMFERESTKVTQYMPHVIKTDFGKFYDIRTMQPLSYPKRFTAPRGGILAENMGLGKTCICLALICLTKYEISENELAKGQVKGYQNSLVDICTKFINQNSIPWKQYYDDFPTHLIEKLELNIGVYEDVQYQMSAHKTRSAIKEEDFEGFKVFKKYYLSSCTLIVIPDNLFHQWNLEIAKHTKKDFLNILQIPNVKTIISNDIKELAKYDVILISMNAFSRQSQIKNTILKEIYFKRIIIDEGHSMNSKTTLAVSLAREMNYERMWAISGTPTSGMTNIHLENDFQEYTVRKDFDAKQDLIKLGAIISNYLKIEPWYSNPKKWVESIIKPMNQNQFGIDLQLKDLLNIIIVRHTIDDVESDIKLPDLHHKPIFIDPSFFDKLSINLFVSVLATNAVTSERKDVDYMFHTNNKADLRRLITNLRKATFYWTGFSIKDVENLLNICVFALKENESHYSKEDVNLLKRSIYISKLALSNMRWRSTTTIHEMGYFVDNLPSTITAQYSLVQYYKDIFLYGFPQLISLQKFYYKNRITDDFEKFKSKIDLNCNKFWDGYWKSINNKSKDRLISNKEEYKDFNTNDIEIIGELPDWVEGFDPKLEEDLFFNIKHDKKRKLESLIEESEEKGCGKRVKHANLSDISIKNLRDSQIVGTSSAKLTYLALKLLENQRRLVKSIVFYEFENSAYYLSEFLDLIGVNYLMYSTYIKINERSRNLAEFETWDVKINEGIVLIMDLKLASHGLTIVSATNVYFINPIWNKTIEAQAIKRSHRIGQMNEVHVETLILKNTIEEEMYLKRKQESESGIENDIELIDHSQMKEYILDFQFLRMFDEDYKGEYCSTEIRSNFGQDLNEPTEDNQDQITMRTIKEEFDSKNSVRYWNLPLFTERNMTKLSNEKIKSSFDMNKNIQEIQEQNDCEKNDKKLKSIKLLEKFREKKVKNVRFCN